MKGLIKLPRSNASVAVIVIVAIVASACADLGSISTFTATSVEAGQSFPDVVQDMFASCVRTAMYEPDAMQRAELEKCKQRHDLEPALIGAHKVLVDYLQALGTLASDKVVTYDSALTGLQSQVQSAGKFNKSQVDAIGGVVKALLDAAVSQYRRQQLGTVIAAHNSDIATLTQGLQAIVGSDYKQLLENERSAMDNFYETTLHNYGLQEPLAVVLVTRIRRSDQDALQRRVDAADAYVKVLANIAEGHQRLYDSRSKLDSKIVLDTINQYTKTIGDLIDKLHKAFKA